jgi:peptidoglycan/xylan/chitin deacetylase (PgdA/CDA1 family)
MLLACGGFDERFVRARETADFGLRLWKMGVRFRYLPTAVTYHLYVKPTRDLVQTDARWYGRNEVLLCRKHPDYRPYSALAGLGDGPLWKRFVRWLAVRLPLLPELLVGLSCWMLERLRWIPSIRIIGVRLLQVWQGIAMYRSALGETGSWDALCREFGIRLPVLIYHHVGPMQPNTYPELTISPQQFERQVSWLARHGYVGICSSDWLAWLRKGEPLPKKPVLLAFDDAYADIAEYALPVLQRYDFSATVFVVTRQIGGTNAWDVAQGSGTRQLMTAGQIKEWANKGIEFGAHSRTHPDLTNLTNAELDEEVAGSADDLAGILGNRIISFAYPGGYYNHAVRDFVQSTFDLAFSCNSGVNDLKTDPYILRRTMVQPCDFLIDLGYRVRLGWSPINRLRSYLRLRSRARALMQLLSAQNS